MKAVIFAAGASTRTLPLTENRPKPLLKILNKTILEYSIEAVSPCVDGIILIVNYQKDQIIAHIQQLKKKFKGITFTIVEQKEQKGTGHALLMAEKVAGDKFIAMNGDDLYAAEDIKLCLKHKLCSLAHDVADPTQYGIMETDNEGKLLRLIEKPKQPKGNLANTGLHVLDKRIFPILKKLKPSPRGEIELTDAIHAIAQKEKYMVVLSKAYWFPLTYPWSLLNAHEFFMKQLKKSRIAGIVEKGVSVKGPLIVGKGTVIKSGTYIEGPVIIGEDCEIGPNAYLRSGVCLGNSCKVGQAVEIKNSIVMDHSKVPHLSYVGDSIIGEKVNLGAGTVTANLRHDHANIKSLVKGKLIDTGRRKLGAIIGDEVHTGIHTSIYPGRKIFSKKITVPGETVQQDVI